MTITAAGKKVHPVNSPGGLSGISWRCKYSCVDSSESQVVDGKHFALSETCWQLNDLHVRSASTFCLEKALPNE